MFLILGTSECKYCHEAKKLLNNLNLKYIYIDLVLKYGDNWRSIFTLLKSILNTQRSIPIIFKDAIGAEKTNTDKIVLDQNSEINFADWQLVGTFFDLQDLIDDTLDLSISDDY